MKLTFISLLCLATATAEEDRIAILESGDLGVKWEVAEKGSISEDGKTVTPNAGGWFSSTYGLFRTGPLSIRKDWTACLDIVHPDGIADGVKFGIAIETAKLSLFFDLESGTVSGYPQHPKRKWLAFDAVGQGSRLPTKDFQTHICLQFDREKDELHAKGTMDGRSYYSLLKNLSPEVLGGAENFVLAVEVESGTKLTNLKVMDAEQQWVQEHTKKGAKIAASGGNCQAESAECGSLKNDRPQCWGVCDVGACGPPRYCMCYPKGYYTTGGAFMDGAHCLTRGCDCDPETDEDCKCVPAAAYGVKDDCDGPHLECMALCPKDAKPKICERRCHRKLEICKENADHKAHEGAHVDRSEL